MKEVIDPAIMDLNAISAISDFLCGAKEPSAPIEIPIDAKFEKPHNAYVTIASDRGYEKYIRAILYVCRFKFI